MGDDGAVLGIFSVTYGYKVTCTNLLPHLFSLPGPLSPTNVSLSSGGDNGSLQAQWSSPAGNRDFYLVTLQQDESKTPTRNVSVGGDSTRITFHSLSPGTQYTVQVTAMAGPYRASSQSAATWTRK